MPHSELPWRLKEDRKGFPRIRTPRIFKRDFKKDCRMPPAGCIAGTINTEIYPEVETSYFPCSISSSLERNWWITYFETQLWDTLNSPNFRKVSHTHFDHYKEGIPSWATNRHLKPVLHRSVILMLSACWPLFDSHLCWWEHFGFPELRLCQFQANSNETDGIK